MICLPSSAWVPTTMSTVPSARPCFTFFRSAFGTSREACATFTGKPRKRSVKVLKCWRASSVVGTIDGDLLAAHRRDEGRAQRHLGLAEADVAAHQAVHRLAGAEIVEHRVDDGLLVLGLVVREAGAELLVHAVRHGEARRLAQQPRGRDLDQLARHLADAVLQPRLARLPAGAAEPVELDAGLLRAVARQQLDVLDRQIELGVLGVVQLEAVVRRARRLDGLQADEAADAVIDMHHEVAGIEAGDLGDEIFRPLRGAAAAHQPVAQNVLLGDDREVVGLEAGFEAEHRERDLGLRAASARRGSPRRSPD